MVPFRDPRGFQRIIAKVMPSNRRFPPPWSIEDIGACFIVKDGTVGTPGAHSDVP